MLTAIYMRVIFLLCCLKEDKGKESLNIYIHMQGTFLLCCLKKDKAKVLLNINSYICT